MIKNSRPSSLKFTNMGFFNKDNTMTISSAAFYDNRNKMVRRLGTVPTTSIIPVVPRISRPKPLEIAPFEEMMGFIYGLSLGSRAMTPSYEHTFLDKPVKTFMAENYRPNFELTMRNAFLITSQYNYHEQNRLNPDVGVLELVEREYRFIQGTLTRMILISMNNWQDEKDGVKERFYTEKTDRDANKLIRFKDIDEDHFAQIRKILRNDDRIILYLNGIATLCNWRDRQTKRSDSLRQRLIRWYGNPGWELIDSLPKTAEDFLLPETIQHIIEIGKLRNDTLYVIKDGTEDVIEVMRDREHDGQYANFIYNDENTSVVGVFHTAGVASAEDYAALVDTDMIDFSKESVVDVFGNDTSVYGRNNIGFEKIDVDEDDRWE